MGKKSKDFFDLLASENDYFIRLVDIAISSFNWLNLPEGVDERYIELMLFELGKINFFYDEDAGVYQTLPCTWDRWDNIGNPSRFHVFSNFTGYTNTRTNKDSVLIWNNQTRTTQKRVLKKKAETLALIDKLIKANLRTQRTPWIIDCDEDEVETMKQLFREIERSDNTDAIVGRSGVFENGVKVHNLNSPYLIDKLQQARVNEWNDALTILGIPNMQMQKKERQIRDEVNQLSAGSFACMNSRNTARQIAVNAINKMFDLEIECAFNFHLVDSDLYKLPELEEGAINE